MRSEARFGARGAAAALLVFALATARCGSSEAPAGNLSAQDGGADAGDTDAGPDGGDADAGAPDAGAPDAGAPDAGAPDAGTPDAGAPDAGTPDAGTPDAGAPDAGTPDGGTDGGTVAGPPTPVLTTPSGHDAFTHSIGPVLSVSADEGGNVWAVSATALHVMRAGATSFETYPNGQGDVGTATCSNGSTCQNAGLLSVAGGAAGEAWVGYRGIYFNGTEQDDPTVPLGIRESGGVERFHLTGSGIQRDRSIGQACGTTLDSAGHAPPPVALPDGHIVFCTPPGVLHNEPTGRWKMRFIWTIQYNHGPAGNRGDVFFGGNHGMAVWNATIAQRSRYAALEHQHAGWNYSKRQSDGTYVTSLLCGDHHGVALDALSGNVWTGADFGVARLHYNDGFPGGDFYGQDIPAHSYEPGSTTVPDNYLPYGFRTWGCTNGVRTCVNESQDPSNPEYGGRDYVQALSFDAYGNLWVASYLNGLAQVPIAPGPDGSRVTGAATQADVRFWNWNRRGERPGWTQQTYDFVLTVAGDPDGSVWLGTDSRNGGSAAYRFVAASGQWVSYGSVVPGHAVSQIALDPRPLCDGTQAPPACTVSRTVYFASDSGVTVYTGP